MLLSYSWVFHRPSMREILILPDYHAPRDMQHGHGKDASDDDSALQTRFGWWRVNAMQMVISFLD